MIPKTIHYCWLSGEPYSEPIGKCIQSWMVYLPGYQLVLWDLNKVEREFLLTTNSTNLDETKLDVSQLHEGCEVTDGNLWLKQTIALKKYAFAADFIRIYALFHYGGIYLDADVEIVASLDPFLNHDFFIGFESNNDLEPAVFGAVKGHPWLTDLLDYYGNRSFIKNRGEQDIKPLPLIFNETAIDRFGFKVNGKMQNIFNEGIAVYPCDYFSPKNIYLNQIKRTINTVAIHNFDSSWVIKSRIYNLKHIFHQILYRLGGKSFHNYIVQLIRRIFK
jgi:hypothetical protein